MTFQEMFTQSFLGLKAQGFRQAVNLEGDCCYRTPSGLKCAVGHLIPDELYHSNMEGETPSNLPTQIFPAIALSFLHSLQRVHDHADTPEVMETQLRLFAATHSLEVPQ